MAELTQIRLPGLFPVQGEIRVAAAQIIGALKGLNACKYAVRFLKSDDLPEETKGLFAGFPVVPAGPAQLVVLTIGIVVALLRV